MPKKYGVALGGYSTPVAGGGGIKLNVEPLVRMKEAKLQREAAAAKPTGITDPKNIDYVVEGIDSGAIPPDMKNVAFRDRTNVIAGLQKRGVQLSTLSQQWFRAQKQISALNSPALTRLKVYGVSVVNTIDRVKELAQELKLEGIPTANKIELTALIEGTGSNSKKGQLAAQYITAVNTLREEFANLAQGGVPTESTWELAKQQINGNYDVNKLGATLAESQRLINYRLQAIEDAEPSGKYGIGEVKTGVGTEQTPSDVKRTPKLTVPKQEKYKILKVE